MTGIKLKILPEKTDRKYVGGEKVRGQVQVTADGEFPAAAMALGFLCEGCSRDNRYRNTILKEGSMHDLFKGAMAQGTNSYPFELDLPPLAYTHTGFLFDVHWYLKAIARVSDGKKLTDIEETIELSVSPDRTRKEEKVTATADVSIYTEKLIGVAVKMGIFASVVLFIAAAAFFYYKTDNHYPGYLLTGGGIFLSVLTARYAMLGKRFQKFDLRIGSKQIRTGQIMPCSISFQPGVSFEIDRISVALRATETISYVIEHGGAGSITSSADRSDEERSIDHVVYERAYEFPLSSKHVRANVPFYCSGEVPIPADAPCTVGISLLKESFELKWQLDFRMQMKNFPDWTSKESIVVLP